MSRRLLHCTPATACGRTRIGERFVSGCGFSRTVRSRYFCHSERASAREESAGCPIQAKLERGSFAWECSIQPRSGDVVLDPGRQPGAKWETCPSRGAAFLVSYQTRKSRATQTRARHPVALRSSQSEERRFRFVAKVRFAKSDFQFAFFIESDEKDPRRCEPQRRPHHGVQRLQPQRHGNEEE